MRPSSFETPRRLILRSDRWQVDSCPNRTLEEIMPEIIIHLAEGRTADAKKALMKDITEAVVKNLGAKPETVTVSIIETPRALKMKGGVLFSER
jgi:4-oxalocrotonate tautomerase